MKENKPISTTSPKTRLYTRIDLETKQLFTDHSRAQNISLTDFIIESGKAAISQSFIQNEIQKSFCDHSFYNFAQAYASTSPAIKNMMKEFHKSEVYNHEKH